MPPKTISDFLPEAEAILALEPEELAGLLLEFLIYESIQSRPVKLNRHNFTQQGNFRNYPPNLQEKITEAVTEAWVWLEREGLIAPRPGQSEGWVFITRRGQKLENRAGVEAYRKSNLLPKGLLHPTIAIKVYSAFLRGEYDTAVFQAFREVEVAVRNAGNFASTDTGVDLMRKAFHETTGPLTDLSEPVPERQAVSHLFAGAIGYFRNPSGHRNVTFLPEEAVEIIMFASHLLRIVDSHP